MESKDWIQETISPLKKAFMNAIGVSSVTDPHVEFPLKHPGVSPKIYGMYYHKKRNRR